MSDETSQVEAPEGQTEKPPEPSIGDVLTELRSQRERSDAKVADLAKQLQKIRERIRGEGDSEAEDGKRPSPPAGDFVSRAEAQAMSKVERSKATLSEDLASLVDEVAESQGYEIAAALAERLQKAAPQPKPKPAPGAASAPAAATSDSKSTMELVRLKRENPAEYRRYMELVHAGQREIK